MSGLERLKKALNQVVPAVRSALDPVTEDEVLRQLSSAVHKSLEQIWAEVERARIKEERMVPPDISIQVRKALEKSLSVEINTYGDLERSGTIAVARHHKPRFEPSDRMYRRTKRQPSKPTNIEDTEDAEEVDD